VIEWLYFLKSHHPDYRWITINKERLSSLPLDGDISALFPTIVDEEQGRDSPEEHDLEPALDETIEEA
jgi:hypothetical protein